MGGIPGAKYTLMRTIGMIINLVTVIVVLVLIGVGTSAKGISAMMISGPIIGAILLIFLLKAEYDFVDDHRPLLLTLAMIIGLVVEIIAAYSLNLVSLFIADYLPLILSLYGLIIFWHYTLTIYKNEKKRYWIGLIVYLVLWGGFALSLITLVQMIIPLILLGVSVLLTNFAERTMIKKKMLKFI